MYNNSIKVNKSKCEIESFFFLNGTDIERLRVLKKTEISI